MNGRIVWGVVAAMGLGFSACGRDAANVQRGIYRLEEVKQQDTCSLDRRTGDRGLVAIDTSGGTTLLPRLDDFAVPDSPGIALYTPLLTTPLPFPAGYDATLPLGSRCAEGTERQELEWRSVDAPLEVHFRRTWTGVKGCMEQAKAEIPEGSCKTDVLLRYTLVEACADECTLSYSYTEGAGGAPSCTCPN